MSAPPKTGRRSFERQAWSAAFAELSAADRERALAPDDLERLAIAAYLIGEDRESTALWARAHDHGIRDSDARRAARCAFWLAFGLLLTGEMAPAGGWLGRAHRVLDDEQIDDCVERGLLLVPDALGRMIAGDHAGALCGFSEALAVGERHGDVDLATLGRLGRGQALVLGGSTEEGVAELDEVMVAVVAGEASPMIAGLVYCAVIEMCHLTFDLRRATEWTAALSRWCEAQPDLVPYRGQCLVHRAEILQFRGAWADAMDEVERASVQLSRPPGHPALGDALYRQAELLRLRGDHERAEDAYRRASELGRDPQPGLARLRLAQGRTAAAASAIRRAVGEAPDGVSRARLLSACVEIELAAGDLDGARRTAEELDAISVVSTAPRLGAVAAHATGLVLLAEGDGRAALGLLRPAWATWRDLAAPYEAAQVRVAIGRACRLLGDEDGAQLELDAAANVFRELGAVADIAAAQRLASPADDTPAGPLSARELEVLALVVTGMTNRAIASELVISAKTVARHVANIFTKLGVSSRAAATAYAYDHGLTHPSWPSR